jgi:hypothetical protein
MRHLVREHWSLGVGILIWMAILAVLTSKMLASTGGRVVYGLDDAYIHLAIAKHLVQNGVWGVTPYAFSASSSSVVWPLILAGAFRLFGMNEAIPFLINVLLSFVFIVLLYQWARPLVGSSWGTLVLLLGFLLLVPVPTLVFNGMETLLQVLVSFALFARVVEHVGRPQQSDRILLPALGAGLAAIRYEGLFIILIACALLLVRKEYLLAISMASAGALPVAVLGIVSMGQGWSFLPNSIMVKHSPLSFSDWPSILALVMRPFGTIADTFVQAVPRWAGLEVGVLFLGLFLMRSRRHRRLWDESVAALALFVGVALIHSLLISEEWFYRYGAYLDVLGLTDLAYEAKALVAEDFEIAKSWRPMLLPGVLVGVLLGFPLAKASVEALLDTPLASRNIYDQQQQMALFLKEHYSGQAVAANDIGAIDFYSNLHLMDLFGLASREVALDKLDGQWNSKAIAAISDRGGTVIAVVFDSWFVSTGLPPSWIKVAEWTIEDNVVCGSDTVSWYGVGRGNAEALASNLRNFEPQLPRQVAVRNLSGY